MDLHVEWDEDIESMLTPEELMEIIAKTCINQMNTIVIAYVTEINDFEGWVDCQPVVRYREVSDDESQTGFYKMPMLLRCPMDGQGRSGVSICVPYSKNDWVVVGFLNRSHREWYRNGSKDQTPRSLSVFDINDGIIMGSIQPFCAPLQSREPDALVIGTDRYKGGGQENETRELRLRVKPSDRIELCKEVEGGQRSHVRVGVDGAVEMRVERSGDESSTITINTDGSIELRQERSSGADRVIAIQADGGIRLGEDAADVLGVLSTFLAAASTAPDAAAISAAAGTAKIALDPFLP